MPLAAHLLAALYMTTIIMLQLFGVNWDFILNTFRYVPAI